MAFARADFQATAAEWRAPGEVETRRRLRLALAPARNVRTMMDRSNPDARSAMPLDTTPILVGCGDVTDMTTPVEKGRSPFDLIAEAGRLALAHAGAPGLAAKIDTLAMLRLFADTSHRFAPNLGTSAHPPKRLAERPGPDPAPPPPP